MAKNCGTKTEEASGSQRGRLSGPVPVAWLVLAMTVAMIVTAQLAMTTASVAGLGGIS